MSKLSAELHLSAFDLDRTIFRGNSSLKFCIHLIRKKKLSWFALIYSIHCYLLLQFEKLSVKELHKKVFSRFLVGFSLEEINKEVQIFISSLSKKAFYLPAWLKFNAAKERGDVTVLLSSSPDFLVGPLASFMGFAEFRATVYAVDNAGKLCDISSVLEGEDKAHLLKQLAQTKGINIENTIAYSDSYLDVPFLQAAGTAVAVNPDRRLARISRSKNWLTI